MKQTLQQLLGKQMLYLDGGTGSVLQQRGLAPGEFPETWNITHPDIITDLHYRYYMAGSNIVLTNTFGAYSLKFPRKDLEAIIKAAVSHANKARQLAETGIPPDEAEKGRAAHVVPEGALPAERLHFVALDIGPCGKLLKPMGDMDFEDAVSLFKETMKTALECEGLDAIFIETMNDSYEMKAAVVAAKEAIEESELYSGMPILASTVYDEKGKLLTGADTQTMAVILEGLGVSALGMNCSLGPKQMALLVPRLFGFASLPVIAKPNAGLPRSDGGRTVYDVSASQFADSMKDIARAGASVLGGCCGTTPEYICRLVNATQDIAPLPVSDRGVSAVSSYARTVAIGGKNAAVIIGERINPTGKKRFKEALRNNDMPYIVQQGLEQEAAGAQVLDVNVGLPDIDEEDMMVSVMQELQAVSDLPLQIDTGRADVMERALRRYNGKALVNSVNGKKAVMEAVFPLVKKYGGVVVALTIDENGIPPTATGRAAIAKRIYIKAAEYGIAKKDIIIDPLAMAVSSDGNAAAVTLEALRLIHAEGGNTILGVSNVSFGLPERSLMTSAFFTVCMEAGLSAAIMNPLSKEMQMAYACFLVLHGFDAHCLNYISQAERYGQQRNEEMRLSAGSFNSTSMQNGGGASPDTLEYAIEHGLKEQAARRTEALLASERALFIIEKRLMPSLDKVGKSFEAKTLYLPQLLMSAEAAKSAFSVIKDNLARTGSSGRSKGTVIIATVKGDIHDIGKNIVKVLLENYGFAVIDMGKDVPPEKIAERALSGSVRLVGLSALMTTTVPYMEETIKQLREKSPATKICVGGAVMTQKYADMIHADFYAKDAMATVKYAQKVFCT